MIYRRRTVDDDLRSCRPCVHVRAAHECSVESRQYARVVNVAKSGRVAKEVALDSPNPLRSFPCSCKTPDEPDKLVSPLAI